MKTTITREGITIAPESVADEMYLEAIVRHPLGWRCVQLVPDPKAWGVIAIAPNPPKPVVPDAPPEPIIEIKPDE